ncbi:MAG: EAL domain-containing protein [Sedimenticola sp.]|nr:EAL domain-containing protein [Sedimenticola sp.]
MKQDAGKRFQLPPWLIYGLLYLLATGVSYQFNAFDPDISAIWFASGIAMGAILLHGPRVLPGILLAALISSGLHYRDPLVVTGMSVAVILEALVGYGLMRYFSDLRRVLVSPAQIVRFLLYCVLVAPLFSALPGCLLLWSTGALQELTTGILVWWAGNALGIMLLTPLILAWAEPGHAPQPRVLTRDKLLLLLLTLCVCALLFGPYLPPELHSYPLTFLLAPLLVWSVFHFPLQTTSLLLLVVAITALFSTALGQGPFEGMQGSYSMLFLQLYIGTVCATALIGKVVLNERQQIQDHLKLAHKVIQHSPDAIVVTDNHTRIISANPAFVRNSGFSMRELLGHSINILKSGYHDGRFFTDMWNQLKRKGAWQGEIWNRDKSGSIRPEWLNIVALENGGNGVTGYIGIYSDVARRQDAMDRIHHLAYYDILTNLPNRQLFNDRLEQAIKYANRNKRLLGLLFIDLDRFKTINDTLGHSAGDKVLSLAAERLQACVRQTDTLARLAGDEFTIILQDINEDFDAVLVAEKVLQHFKSPLRLDDHELYITPSIGIALFPDNATSADDLITFSDTAMYRAKEMGGNNYQLFDSNMSEPFRWNLEVETALRRAIEHHSIRLKYQPQFDLHTGAIIGVEGLARWHDPELGVVSPGTFIRVAENTGIIHALGEQVLNLATEQAIRWGQQGIRGLRIAVNVSPLQLKQQEFFQRVKAITGRCSESGNRIELEITETSLMENAEFMEEVLGHLSGLGLEVAVDDFGTGYSSLSYLKRLPIDLLKIDQSFVRDLPGNSNDTAICRAIIAMAHSLNLSVLAEGVETEQQMQFLRKENCDEMQGFLFSKPVTADEIGEMIRQGFWQVGENGNGLPRSDTPASSSATDQVKTDYSSK